MKIKTIKQAEELGLEIHSYGNDSWGYEDTDGYYHLIRNDNELLPEVKKLDICSFSSGDWVYKDTNDYWHLFINDEEMLPEVKKLDIHSPPNGDWEYEDTNKEWHTIKGATMKIKTIEDAQKLGLITCSYKNGDWIYEDLEDYEYLFRDGKELLPNIKKLKIHLFSNGDWMYEDEDGIEHLMRDGEEIAFGSVIKEVESGKYAVTSVIDTTK